MGIGMLRQYHQHITEDHQLTHVPEAVEALLGPPPEEVVAESAKEEEKVTVKPVKFSIKTKNT